MTVAVAGPEPGPVPGTDPESPYTSRRARIVIAVVVGGLSLALGLVSAHSLLDGLDGYPWGLRAADVAFGLGGYVALWWRRRWPLAFAGYILLISVFSTLSGGLPFVAAFTVAVHRHWPTALVTSTLLALAAWPGLLLYRDDSMRDTEILFLFVVIMIFAVTGWGMFIRARRQLLASLRRRAERAERSREEHASHARIAERQRIAREMHDVLAHRLSLLSVQAGALEVTPSTAPGDAAATEAAAAIRATTHLALQELRSIVRVLRDDDEPGTAPPQPVAADLPALVAEASATSTIRADWDDVELAAVPPDTGRTLYRIVQEGLTNARKHAPGSAVEVTVDGAPDRGLSVTITSWLPPGQPAPGPGATPGTGNGTGAGLIGLRERAALAGGHIEAKVTGGNRFRLSGWLPWAAR